METRINECRRIRNEFLQKWPFERIHSMTLEEYVSVHDKETFCYGVERETIRLGSIRGHPSIKFGIYEREDKEEIPGTYVSDEEYSWAKFLDSKTRTEAFKKVRSAVESIIISASNNDFTTIDRITFNHLGKWKIASLYCDEQFVPIFKKETLWNISESLGLPNPKKLPFSAINAFLLEQKPLGINIYRYAQDLLNEYNWSDEPGYYLVGSKYDGDRDMLPLMEQASVIATGFEWKRDFSYLYGSPEKEITRVLASMNMESKARNALKYFLQLKPGDLIAIKSSGNPRAGEPFLEIVAYAVVVQREGKVYYHDDINFGHCVNVEYIKTGFSKIFELGGYGRTIQYINHDLVPTLFGDLSDASGVREKVKRRRRRRKASTNKNATDQSRKGSNPYVARMIHNQIQERFREHLIDQFGEEHVVMEEDNVDLKLLVDNEVIFYEIKPYAFAEDCIRAGLGQLLTYSYFDKSGLTKKLRIVGPYSADEDEKKLIEFIKSQLSIDFGYEVFNPDE
jgi:hypothetical protein